MSAILPYGFSAGHFISSVGADAGFAAILGLGILVLLYFAQARETALLREQVLESTQQVQDLERRLAELARSPAALGAGFGETGPGAGGAVPDAGAGLAGGAGRAQAALGGFPAVMRSPAGAGAAAATPAPPAGVGAPALNAATKLIPTPDQAVLGWPAPSTAAAGGHGGNGGSGGRGDGGGVGAAAAHATPGFAAPPASGSQARRAPAGAPRGSLPPERGRRRTGTRGRVALLLAALVAAAAAVVLVVVTSVGGGNQAPVAHARSTNAPVGGNASQPARFNPSSVTVAVLNGTATLGLAHKVAVRLAAAGYMEGTVRNAVDQTLTTSVVAYTRHHKRAALAVASSLNLGSTSVQPIDASTQAIACPPPSPCTAKVAVTVGSDLASR